MRLLAVILLAMSLAAACSDRVPAPTPSPRPGYPPAPSSELPEGVLFLEARTKATWQSSWGMGASPDPPMVFGIGPDGEARAYELSLSEVSPDGSRALTARSQTGEVISAYESQFRVVTSLLGVMTGSTYEEISNASGTADTAIWSNDGKRLAYTRQNDSVVGDNVDVWTLDADTGATRRLTTEADFYWGLGWTATGEVLARTAEGLVILGKTQRVVPLPEAVGIVDAVLSPDGSQLLAVFGETTEGAQGVFYIHSSGIWIGGLDGSDWRRVLDLTDEPPGVLLTAAPLLWSPDGTRIALHRTRVDDRGIIADGLSVVDVRTGEETRVHDQGWGGESWSLDGRYLAYMYHVNTEFGVPVAGPLGILRPDGLKREVEAQGMVWTKDGRLLVNVNRHPTLLDPETMEMEEIVTDEGKRIFAEIEVAVWSPSGRYAALATLSDAYNRSSLYIIDTEEGTAEVFLDKAGFSAVAWLSE